MDEMKDVERTIEKIVSKRVNAELKQKREEFNQKIDKVIELLKSLKFNKKEQVEYKEDSVLNKPVEELNLSVRAYNALRSAQIYTIGDLVAKNESQLLGYRGFGKKALSELIELLEERNLKFGMSVSDHLKNPEE